MKFGSLFTGGGGFDIGAKAAGLELAWGVEYIPEIAEWCNSQLGEHVRVADILEVDPADFEPVDYLHASPPCPNFSVANSNKGETEQDVAMGEAVARFIRHHRPKYFSLENVYGYRHSQSWAAIVGALHECGYGFIVEHINSADFGVPQKRRRMIVRAVRDTFFSPAPMRPSHAEGGAGGLLPWVGWWEAVADIADTFPPSQLAPWQVKRLGNAEGKAGPLYSDMQNPSRDYTVCDNDEPATTVLSTFARRPIGEPRAILAAVSGEASDFFEDAEPSQTVTGGHGAEKYRVILGNSSRSQFQPEDTPSDTITGHWNQAQVRAVLVEGVSKGDRPPTTNGEADPAFTIETGAGGRLHRAVLVARKISTADGKQPNYIDQGDPSHAPGPGRTEGERVILNGFRVVALTPRALARFQTFPDWYELPEKKTLAVTIIGNAVPCLLAQRIVESLVCSA